MQLFRPTLNHLKSLPSSSRSLYSTSSLLSSDSSSNSSRDNPKRDHSDQQGESDESSSSPADAKNKSHSPTPSKFNSIKPVNNKDEEHLSKLQDRFGGAETEELEDGKPVGLKRNVRENMFRLI